MPIIVEDGSIVAGANSYVSLDDARAYVTERNAELPADDGEAEAVLFKAMDYLESFDARFKGDRVERDQPLSWPRTGVVIENWSWSSDEIPRQLIAAQLALVLEGNAGADHFNPAPVTTAQTRKKVGPIEVEYANPGASSKVSKTAPSSTLINLLLQHSGLSLIRV